MERHGAKHHTAEADFLKAGFRQACCEGLGGKEALGGVGEVGVGVGGASDEAPEGGDDDVQVEVDEGPEEIAGRWSSVEARDPATGAEDALPSTPSNTPPTVGQVLGPKCYAVPVPGSRLP